MDIKKLLSHAIDSHASDIHLSTGIAPMIRIDGELHSVSSSILEQETVMQLLNSIMTDDQQQKFNRDLELDFSIDIAKLARFRVNIFQHNRGTGAAFRIIPNDIPTLEELQLPAILKKIANYPRGLILVAGPTGSGKSTTLAAIINYINHNRAQHIITIEDPIEFVHHSNRCLINQREVHRDTHAFHSALRSALREDPDIILLGELRDLETIRLAMTAAETGHLVFGTLHTTSAAKTINRIIDVFPAEEKMMIRTMLSESLQAVISQLLIPKKLGNRIAVHEILLNNAAIANLIREDKIAQMYSTMQTNASIGMKTLEQNLKELIQEDTISLDLARSIANHQDLL